MFSKVEMYLPDYEHLRSAVEDIERSASCRWKIAVSCVSGVLVTVVL
jgi:hypothetical protein